ncbi:MAG: septum formation initiator family protein [bacterium]
MKKLKLLFKRIKDNRFINKYTITLTVFFVWLIFFDANSILNMLEARREQREVDREAQIYKNSIEKNRETIEILSTNRQSIEKFAREEYKMKRENEDIFIIKE